MLGLWVWLFYWRFRFGSLLKIDFARDLYFCDCWFCSHLKIAVYFAVYFASHLKIAVYFACLVAKKMQEEKQKY